MIAQPQMRTHSKYGSTPMRSFTHQWNLSRIFGSQSVGSASSRSWPEAGIATRIIPAQSSRWTLHGQGDVFCRLGDLATWRLGDLANLIIGDTGPRILLRPQLRRFVHLQHKSRGICSKPTFQTTPAPPRAQQLSERLLQYYRWVQLFITPSIKTGC